MELPLVTDPVSLRAQSHNGQFHLTVQQPFNQALQLEVTDHLTAPNWQRLDLPGTEPTYPALPRDLDFELPFDDGSHFYRARTEAP